MQTPIVRHLRGWMIPACVGLSACVVSTPCCAQQRGGSPPAPVAGDQAAPSETAEKPEPPSPAPEAVASADAPAAEPASAPRHNEAPARSTPAGNDAPAGDSTGETPAPQPPADAILARGQGLFAKHCTICHGEAGDGQGKFAYLMNPRPRSFQGEPFKLATTENRIPSDADLVRTISRGMPGSAMPPWGHLPQADLQALVAYLRKVGTEATRAEFKAMVAKGELEEKDVEPMVAERRTPGPPLVVPPEPQDDDLHWFRGRKIYLEACASCHGVDGQPVAEAVKYDEQGYPVPPRSFVNGIFKGGSEGHQLYARIVKGMPGTPMPAHEGSYSDDEVWDLIHYVQSLARAGAQERAQLRMSTIVAPEAVGGLPAGPMDAAWDQARPVYVALTPLWWTEERIEGLVVQALHNAKELALRFSWIDATQDSRAVRQHEFRDGVAVQFSLNPDPPFYMGDPSQHGGVNIWYWKADREQDLAQGYQGIGEAFPAAAVDDYPPDPAQFDGPAAMLEARDAGDPAKELLYLTAWASGNLVAAREVKTPVECLVARGPGTLSAKPPGIQLVEGRAAYERGVWYVQMQRAMQFGAEHGHNESDEREFKRGDYLPVSFAIWNGSAGDRDGKKNISIWQKLVIE